MPCNTSLSSLRASRKISNEAEVMRAARSIPAVDVKAVYLERLSVTEQLKAVRQADILVYTSTALFCVSIYLWMQHVHSAAE